MTIDPNILLIVIDSFCGAGGYTEGIERAEIDGNKIVKTIIGINHDKKAIESHAANHPETYHFVEDFTELDPRKLISIVANARIMYPNAKLVFHMSAECTHHSKAKGGMSRDADSRSLPEHAERYVKILNPDIITVENVREFIDWGPLTEKVVCNKKGTPLYCPIDYKKDKKTKKVLSIHPVWVPVKILKGSYFRWWVHNLKTYGYKYEHQLLNAADYGAFTSRIRYFGIFAKEETNIAFPEQTHSRTGGPGKEQWKAVKDVLELDKEGETIFDRKKDLVDATLLRIIAGVEEFAIKEKENFLLKYNSMSQQRKCKCPSVESPSPVVSCQDRIALVKTKFASVAYSGRPKDKNFALDRPAMTITTADHHQLFTTNHLMSYCFQGYNRSLKEPCGTVVTKDQFSLISPKFLLSYNFKDKPRKINSPSPCLLTKDRFGLVTPKFMDQQYGQSKPTGLDKPNGALTANPKFNLYSCKWLMDTQFSNVGTSLDRPCKTITANRKHFYLMNPQFNSKGGSIEKPCFTLIARMDKMPPYLMQTIEGNVKLKINPGDSETMIRLKNLCNEHGIIDILMRMLFIEELKRIMGFGDDYVLKGTKADMKKFIGNAVECTQAKAFITAIGMTIYKRLIKMAV